MLQLSFDRFSWPFQAVSSDRPLSLALLCDGASFAQDFLFKKLDDLTGGALVRACKMRDFSGETGQVVSLLAPCEAIAQVQVIGCAERDEKPLVPQMLEAAGGAAYHALTQIKMTPSEAVILVPEHLSVYGAEIARGASLRSYRFDQYRTTRKKEAPFAALHVALADSAVLADVCASWERSGMAVRDGVFLTRDLVSEPANVLTPESYCERIEALRAPGLEIEVLDEARMRALGFGALLGVAQGSAKKPCTVIIRHYGAASREEAPLAFIGKGVTFDSGGISIKPASGMDEMKTDMGGSAVVVGLMSVLARRKAKVNAVGVVGLVENMLSGEAQRPGDIVTSHSGQTIEVLNTDAEGRLVLADLLSYTCQTYQPELMIDLATLTGAIVVALGSEYAGLFSNHEGLAEALKESGEEVKETLWRMPMGKAYNRQLDSDVADVKNIGGRSGSSILAAEFLGRFVGETAWAHLDIAGTTWKEKASSCAPKGATGYGVQLLNRFVQQREARKIV